MNDEDLDITKGLIDTITKFGDRARQAVDTWVDTIRSGTDVYWVGGPRATEVIRREEERKRQEAAERAEEEWRRRRANAIRELIRRNAAIGRESEASTPPVAAQPSPSQTPSPQAPPKEEKLQLDKQEVDRTAERAGMLELE